MAIHGSGQAVVNHEHPFRRNLHGSYDCRDGSRLDMLLLVRTTEGLKAQIEAAEDGLAFRDLAEDFAALRLR